MHHPDVSADRRDRRTRHGATPRTAPESRRSGSDAGNVPCYIHRSADLHMAVVDILTSKTFDNGTDLRVGADGARRPSDIRARRSRSSPSSAPTCAAPRRSRCLEHTVDRSPRTGRMQPTAVGQSAVDDRATRSGSTSRPTPSSCSRRSQRRRTRPPAVVREALPGARHPAGRRRARGDQRRDGRPLLRRRRPHGVDLLRGRRRNDALRRRAECRPDHRQLPLVGRSARRRLQRSRADVLVRLRHRWRQQHDRERHGQELPERQADGEAHADRPVVPRAEPHPLQRARDREPARPRLHERPDGHQPGPRSAGVQGHASTRCLPSRGALPRLQRGRGRADDRGRDAGSRGDQAPSTRSPGRGRRRLGARRREGDAALLHQPRARLPQPRDDLPRSAQAGDPVPEGRAERHAGRDPDHQRHRLGGDAVRDHHRRRSAVGRCRSTTTV